MSDFSSARARVRERLRTDLRVRIPCTAADIKAEQTVGRYEIKHTRREPTLRVYDSFVETIVVNIDDRLLSWGIEPQTAYEYSERHDDRYVYAGLPQLS
ncbi:hypothetical protein ACODNH_19920 (plasmid) [Haloarcula sp. NS06]|uniref:hypothetical protein n=1 Tax=Haloarcula sp. NS06 TaxID=3409688 RepID=UPI003DA782C5